MALSRMGGSLATHALFVAGQTSPEDLLVTSSDYPASGSYINVADCDSFDVVIHLGSVHNSDTPGFSVRCSDANNGTLDVISSSYTRHVAAGTDDDEMITFHIETNTLPAEHYFVAVTTSGVANASYGDIMFVLWKNSLPVTQTTALLPTAAIHTYHGQA